MKNAFFILILFIQSALISQELFSSPVKMDQPTSEYIEVTEGLKKTTHIKTDFTQSRAVKALTRPLKSSGKMLFSNQLGVYWELTKPFSSKIIIDNEKMINVDDNGKKIIVKAEDKPMLHGFTKIFMAIFSGNTKDLPEHFELFFKGNNDLWQIGLIPKSSALKKALSKITLSGKQQHVEMVLINEANGDITEIHFSNIMTPEKFTVEDSAKFAP
jgi:hypothetical protein